MIDLPAEASRRQPQSVHEGLREASVSTLFHRAESDDVSDAERRAHVLEMLQPRNLERLVHRLVEGTMKQREVARTVLRGLTSLSDINLALAAIKAYEAQSTTCLEQLEDGLVNGAIVALYGSMVIGCGVVVSDLDVSFWRISFL